MARHLFIAQQTLSTWMDQDKISFDGHVMTILADGRQFKLVEAVRFIKVEGGDEDTVGLIGKVKTDEQLVAMGAERYRDSVIFADLAFGVQEGFIGEVFLKKEQEETATEAPEEAPKVAAKKAANEAPTAAPQAPGPATTQPPGRAAAETATAEVSAARTAETAGDKPAAQAEEEAFTLLPKSAIKTAGRSAPDSAGGEPLTLKRKAGPGENQAPAEGSRPMDVARTQPSMPAVEEKDPPLVQPEKPASIIGSGASDPESKSDQAQAVQPAERAGQAQAGTAAKEKDADLSDEELLTRFLLENL